VGRRQRRRERSGAAAPAAAASRSSYADPDGGVLTVRDELSRGTLAALADIRHAPAATQEDRWQRQGELLFERLVVGWEIAGLPLEGQKELLGRYRMADATTRRWVRETLVGHVRRSHPELDL
jgi:hypothetical protein